MTYQYVDLPLNAEKMANLSKELLAGEKRVSKQLIAQTISTYHVQNGGILSKASVGGIAKVALRKLKESGSIQMDDRDHWRWITDPSGRIVSNPVPPDSKRRITNTSVVPANSSSQIIVQTLETPSETNISKMTAGTIYEGEGAGSLYVYHFPTHEELAALKNEDRWLMKIGKTSFGDAANRVLEQLSTGTPEYPVISYVRRTDDPSKLETIVHDLLGFWQYKADSSRGREWFLTNPNEIREVVKFVCRN